MTFNVRKVEHAAYSTGMESWMFNKGRGAECGHLIVEGVFIVNIFL